MIGTYEIVSTHSTYPQTWKIDEVEAVYLALISLSNQEKELI
jgi:hypothetical protein